MDLQATARIVCRYSRPLFECGTNGDGLGDSEPHCGIEGPAVCEHFEAIIVHPKNSRGLEPLLEKIVLRNADSWLFFEEPLEVLIAQHAADVLPVLIGAETKARKDKLFAAGFVTYEAGYLVSPLLNASANKDTDKRCPGGGWSFLPLIAAFASISCSPRTRMSTL